MRLSIRELMMVLTYGAFSMAALRFGGVLATLLLGGLACLLMALAIVALVSRGHRRAFAIGFIIPAVSYAAIHYATGRDELSPHDDLAMATTQAFATVYENLATQTWHEIGTGKKLPDYDPTADPSRHGGGGMGMGGMMTSAPQVYLVRTPEPLAFMMVAHSMLASLAGYIGAKFATYINALDGPATANL